MSKTPSNLRVAFESVLKYLPLFGLASYFAGYVVVNFSLLRNFGFYDSDFLPEKYLLTGISFLISSLILFILLFIPSHLLNKQFPNKALLGLAWVTFILAIPLLVLLYPLFPQQWGGGKERVVTYKLKPDAAGLIPSRCEKDSFAQSRLLFENSRYLYIYNLFGGILKISKENIQAIYYPFPVTEPELKWGSFENCVRIGDVKDLR